uniref:Uncharacterized protein n=1 Tax=Trichinella nativa TaxID=6335 RepID=A0A0V1KJC9_9BILA
MIILYFSPTPLKDFQVLENKVNPASYPTTLFHDYQ